MSVKPTWRIYYRDGSCFDSIDGLWMDAPSEGVLAVVENVAPRAPRAHVGHDYYQLEEDGTVVLRDQRTIMTNVGVVVMSAIKFGWYTSNENMEKTLRRIRQEWEI